MSQPTQTPKQQFLQTALLMIAIFLGLQLVCNSQKPAADARTPTEVFSAMQKLNSEIRDVSIAQQGTAYSSKITTEVNAKRMTEEEGRKARLHGQLLVVDTQFKGGLARESTVKLNAAYVSMVNLKKQFGRDPLWTTPFAVAPFRLEPRTQVTPEQLYKDVEDKLNALYKDDMVIGFIPGYDLIDALVKATGKVPGFSYMFARASFACIVRGIVWPLAQRQLMWSRQMSQLQPIMKELREKYKAPSQQQELQAKMMGVYKEYGINPAAGCLPMLLQIPLFLIVYQCMLHYRFEFKNGVFLWINPAASANSNGFFAPSLGDMDYILLCIYGVSMVVATLLQPVTDPNAVKQQRIIGVAVAILVTVMMFFWPLPSAFVLYWIFTNVLSTIQSLRAYRMPLPPLQKVNAPGGGVYPQSGGAATMNGTFEKTGAPKVQKPKGKKKR